MEWWGGGGGGGGGGEEGYIHKFAHNSFLTNCLLFRNTKAIVQLIGYN